MKKLTDKFVKDNKYKIIEVTNRIVVYDNFFSKLVVNRSNTIIDYTNKMYIQGRLWN